MTTKPTGFIGWGLIGHPQEGVLVPTASGPGLDVSGYHESDYWGKGGEWLGPDCYGVVPIYRSVNGVQFPAHARQYPYNA